MRPGLAIDHGVGVGSVAGPGDRIGSDRPLAQVDARTRHDAAAAAAALRTAFELTDEPPTPPASAILSGVVGRMAA